MLEPREKSSVLVVHTAVITILHHLPKSMAKSAANTHLCVCKQRNKGMFYTVMLT